MASSPLSGGETGVVGEAEQPSATGGGARSALISDLVSQLKHGEITKGELFTKLQQLQGAPPSATTSSSITGTALDTVFSHELQQTGNPQSPAFPGNPAFLPAELNEEASRSTAFSAAEESQAPAVGTKMVGNEAGAVGAAGIFTACDRQAIIKRITDERRRRAEDVRHSWSSEQKHHPCSPYASHDDPSSRAVGRRDSEAAQPPANQGSPTSTAAPSFAHATTGVYRRVAWGQGSEPSPDDTVGRSSGSGGSANPPDEFPFPKAKTSQGGGSREDYGGPDDGGDRTDRSMNDPRLWPMHQRLAPSVQRRMARRTKSTRGRAAARGATGRGNNTNGNNTLFDRRSADSPGAATPAIGGNTGSHRVRGDAEGREELPTTLRQRPVNDKDCSSLGVSSPPFRYHERAACGNGYRPSEPHADEAHTGYQEREGRIPERTGVPRKGYGSVLWEEGDDVGGRGFGAVEQEWPDQIRQRKEGGMDRVGVAKERTVDEEAYHFRSFSEERARRGEELVRRELMSECTFRPKIKSLPQSYGATQHEDAPFLQRVTQWQREKEKVAAARKAGGQEKELEDCTFTPRVNRVSRRCALTRRDALGERHVPVDERLYDESLRRDMDRSHLEAEQVAKEEEKLRQECTFNPELTTAKIAAHFLQQKLQKHRQHQNDNDNNSNSIRDESREVVIIQRWGNYTIPRGRSRYRQAAAAVAAAAAASGGGGGGMWGGDRRVTGVGRGRDWELERCTFKPVVIGARKGMQQAQQYLQYDVVERLTGAAFRDPEDELDKLYHDRDGYGPGRLCRGDVDGDSRKQWPSIEQGSEDKSVSEVSTEVQRQRKEDDMASFHAFLSRQNRMETEKLRHIAAIQGMREPSFKPTICPESIKIHQASNKGDFLHRVARDAARKEHEAVRKQAAGKHDPDCTFRPQITARSSTLPGRSVVELSRGDQLKRETTQRLTKLRAEQELLADTTFRPRITEAASRIAVSRLRVASDPDSYSTMLETLRRRKEESVLRGAIEKERKEVEGCTFKPNTTVCPAYITRIAQSISAAKADNNGMTRKTAAVKPDWR